MTRSAIYPPYVWHCIHRLINCKQIHYLCIIAILNRQKKLPSSFSEIYYDNHHLHSSSSSLLFLFKFNCFSYIMIKWKVQSNELTASLQHKGIFVWLIPFSIVCALGTNNCWSPPSCGAQKTRAKSKIHRTRRTIQWRRWRSRSRGRRWKEWGNEKFEVA